MEELPTIHLGSRANALEKKGIHTERGDYNRKVMEIRGLIDFITRTSASIENFKAKIKDISVYLLLFIYDSYASFADIEEDICDLY